MSHFDLALAKPVYRWTIQRFVDDYCRKKNMAMAG